MQAKPLANVSFDQLLVDTRAKNLFGITADDKLYCYAIEPTGRLALKSVMPFDAATGTVAIDSETHYLYAADGDHSLLVYDISNPSHIVRRQNIVTPIIVQNVAADQASRLLLIWGKYARATGQSSSVLLCYFSHPHLKSAQKKEALVPLQLQQGINTLASAGPYFVSGNENVTLTVYKVSAKSVQPLNRQPLLGADAAHPPSSLVYRRIGSFLYISTYDGAGSARAAQPASALVVCRLSREGQLGPQTVTGKPVSNPRPYLDKTNQFLYIVSEEGTLDSYKIARDGQLSPVGSRLKVLVPTGMVFVSG